MYKNVYVCVVHDLRYVLCCVIESTGINKVYIVVIVIVTNASTDNYEILYWHTHLPVLDHIPLQRPEFNNVKKCPSYQVMPICYITLIVDPMYNSVRD